MVTGWRWVVSLIFMGLEACDLPGSTVPARR
jgi:hypothetical protein